MTNQEMFDKAYIGLRGQNFERAINSRGGCVYLNSDGKRCAWGHVDTSLDATHSGSVSYLRLEGIGLAAQLDDGQTWFATQLQAAHDAIFDDTGRSAQAQTPAMVKEALENLARKYNLTIPQ